MKSVPPRGSGWVRFAVAHVTILVAQVNPPRGGTDFMGPRLSDWD